ncbi:hypothetical protein QQF64_031018 [Cirrhinus molitorella]|uniref:Ig-like domain-containing protein n=1 Tax=Cirrhinus molitorella TaxID=172907 RepID=A0ABR3N5A5_9TELE
MARRRGASWRQSKSYESDFVRFGDVEAHMDCSLTLTLYICAELETDRITTIEESLDQSLNPLGSHYTGYRQYQHSEGDPEDSWESVVRFEDSPADVGVLEDKVLQDLTLKINMLQGLIYGLNLSNPPEPSGVYSCERRQSNAPQYSQMSDGVTLTVSDLKPKPKLTSDLAGAALTGNTVTLTCHMDLSTGWDFYLYKHTLNSETNTTKTNSYTVKIDSVSDGGQFWCRAGRGKPVYYTQYSDALWVNVTVSPKAVVTVRPDERVFRGETVTLRCDIKWGGDTEWTYRWETEGTNNQHKNSVSRISTQEWNISSVKDFNSGKYTCTGQMGTQSSQRSDAVTLTVSAEAQAAVRVSPQPWLTEGDSVTLICEVTGSSTGWTFSWFRDDDHLSDSSRGAGGSYTLSPAALQHTGVYTCRAERGRPAFNTKNSSTQPLWITGVAPSVSLVVSPSRSQHFSSDSLSLSCEDQSNSAGWTVRRYTDRNTEDCSKQTGSTCRIVSLSTSDTGVYWCQSESGEKHHPLNITVHDGDVILVSSVDPVIEGHTLTLHCLHRSTNSPILRADFYKNGSLVQNQTTGEMSITTVSKSHEGFYYCKTERGQSLHSWISVRVSTPSSSPPPFTAVVVGLSVCLLIFISLVLLWRYKKNKDQQRNINQTSVPHQSGEFQMENSPLQSDSHIYDDVTVVTKRDRDPESFPEVTYSEITVKKKIPVDKDDTMTESNDVTYSELRTKVKKCKSKGADAGVDAIYAQPIRKKVSPKAVVMVRPDERVFKGETVTLSCDIKWGGDTEWTYRWEIEGTNNQHKNSVSRILTQEWNISSVKDIHSSKYTCTGQMGTQSSQRSDAVTLTVSAEAQAAVRVSPQPWLTEGDSVTLICEVTGSSTGWTFSWFRDDDHLSDSSRGAGGSYTLSPAALQHTGVYTCRAERGRPAFYTNNSSTQPLWITGRVDDIEVRGLRLKDQSNSAGWTVRRYTDRNTEDCSKQTGSTCRIVSHRTSDTGVYWCQSESGEKHHPLNITVHDGDVILVSSVDPVIEGDTLTLHCLHRSTNSPLLRADFYEDGSLVQNQTTGEMSITTVSKSHEGFYYCKTERGQSLHSWISVRASSSSPLLVTAVVVGLSVCLLIFISLVLLWRYKKNKGVKQFLTFCMNSNK